MTDFTIANHMINNIRVSNVLFTTHPIFIYINYFQSSQNTIHSVFFPVIILLHNSFVNQSLSSFNENILFFAKGYKQETYIIRKKYI